MTKKNFLDFYRSKIRLSAFRWSVFIQKKQSSLQERSITLSQLRMFFHPWYSDGKRQVAYRQALARRNVFALRVMDSVHTTHHSQHDRRIRRRMQHLPKLLWALPVLIDRKTGATLLLDGNTTAAALVKQARRRTIPIIAIISTAPEQFAGDFRIVQRTMLRDRIEELKKAKHPSIKPHR